jgi:hypothetical protein
MLKDGSRSHESRNTAASRSWKGKEMDSLLEPPEEGQTCEHLEFGSLGPI